MDEQTVTVPLTEWLAMNRDIGFAEGLLWGWLHSGEDTEQARKATEQFLSRGEAP